MILTDSADRFVDLHAPEHDAIQSEMAAHAERHGFPIIGRAAGGVLMLLAAARQAESVFEFGSGFGYSATWFLKGMAPSGEIVLTEFDADELAQAEEYLERAGEAHRARFEEGDALEIVEGYDGPFDVVLVDHRKQDYPRAFDLVAPKVDPGGVIVADNVMAGPVTHGDLLAATDRGSTGDEVVAGLNDYLETVRAAEGWESVVLPIGNGLAVSVRKGR